MAAAGAGGVGLLVCGRRSRLILGAAIALASLIMMPIGFGVRPAYATVCRGYTQDCVSPVAWVSGNCSTLSGNNTYASAVLTIGGVQIETVYARANFTSPCYSAWSKVYNTGGSTSPFPWENGYDPGGSPADTSSSISSGMYWDPGGGYVYSAMIRDCCGGFSARAWGSTVYGGSRYYTSTSSI